MQLYVFCMFLVGYPQTPEPAIPLVDWHKLTYLVLTCRKTPINQLIKITCNMLSTDSIMEAFVQYFPGLLAFSQSAIHQPGLHYIFWICWATFRGWETARWPSWTALLQFVLQNAAQVLSVIATSMSAWTHVESYSSASTSTDLFDQSGTINVGAPFIGTQMRMGNKDRNECTSLSILPPWLWTLYTRHNQVIAIVCRVLNSATLALRLPY